MDKERANARNDLSFPKYFPLIVGVILFSGGTWTAIFVGRYLLGICSGVR